MIELASHQRARRLARRRRSLLGALTLAGVVTLAAPAGASAARMSAAQSHWLSLAQSGVRDAQRAWRAPPMTGTSHWYYERLDRSGRYPLATIWAARGLFESINAIAIAQPTRANRAAVKRFARVAETFWNPRQHGYAPYPNDHVAGDTTWFDDNGWWSLAFVNAYRATGK